MLVRDSAPIRHPTRQRRELEILLDDEPGLERVTTELPKALADGREVLKPRALRDVGPVSRPSGGLTPALLMPPLLFLTAPACGSLSLKNDDEGVHPLPPQIQTVSLYAVVVFVAGLETDRPWS
jgi:hypothetical protein